MPGAYKAEPAQRFAATCEEYLALWDQDIPRVQQLLLRTYRLLTRLQAGALELRKDLDLEEGDELRDLEEDRHELQARIAKRFKAFSYYWICLNPLSSEQTAEFGTGDALDDLADVYCDLQEGLAYWRNGKPQTAEFQWRLMFEAHWGDHAASLLPVLHEYLFGGERGEQETNV